MRSLLSAVVGLVVVGVASAQYPGQGFCPGCQQGYGYGGPGLPSSFQLQQSYASGGAYAWPAPAFDNPVSFRFRVRSRGTGYLVPYSPAPRFERFSFQQQLSVGGRCVGPGCRGW